MEQRVRRKRYMRRNPSGAKAPQVGQPGPERPPETLQPAALQEYNSGHSPATEPVHAVAPTLEDAPSTALSEADIAGALQDLARDAILLPMACTVSRP